MSVKNIDQMAQDAWYLGREYYPVQDTEGFQSSATYANEVMPKLRKIAGYEDSGVGTWKQERQVEFTADDYNGVMEASSSELLSEVVDAFWRGASE